MCKNLIIPQGSIVHIEWQCWMSNQCTVRSLFIEKFATFFIQNSDHMTKRKMFDNSAVAKKFPGIFLTQAFKKVRFSSIFQRDIREESNSFQDFFILFQEEVRIVSSSYKSLARQNAQKVFVRQTVLTQKFVDIRMFF